MKKDLATYTPDGKKLFGHVYATKNDTRFIFVNNDRDDHSQFDKENPDLTYVYTAIAPPRPAELYIKKNYC